VIFCIDKNAWRQNYNAAKREQKYHLS